MHFFCSTIDQGANNHLLHFTHGRIHLRYHHWSLKHLIIMISDDHHDMRDMRRVAERKSPSHGSPELLLQRRQLEVVHLAAHSCFNPLWWLTGSLRWQ